MLDVAASWLQGRNAAAVESQDTRRCWSTEADDLRFLSRNRIARKSQRWFRAYKLIHIDQYLTDLICMYVQLTISRLTTTKSNTGLPVGYCSRPNYIESGRT